jgi:DNA-binding PadR family transcriptional regulator
VRNALLALLADGPAHGYELKHTLEHRLGALLPPLNAGQIYTTLGRLERDGLVEGTEVPEDARNKRVYKLTERGRDALADWVDEPVPGPHVRDEFFMKLVLVGLGSVRDATSLIERQRREYLQALRDLEQHAGERADGIAAELLVEGAALHLEANLRWLDLCEQRVLAKEAIDGNGSRS